MKKYTWTYTTGDHPYLRCTKIGLSLHEFVLGFIYGAENIDKMQAEGNIIEHLDNDGLNCTYENLHILSEDMNKQVQQLLGHQSIDTTLQYSMVNQKNIITKCLMPSKTICGAIKTPWDYILMWFWICPT